LYCIFYSYDINAIENKNTSKKGYAHNPQLYKTIEDLLSDDSEENYLIRQKIIRILSTKKSDLISELGIINSMHFLQKFLF
jgi:hypothetical protein